MTNSQLAAIVLVLYCIPGLLIVWFTMNSEKHGPVIDKYTLFEQVLFVAANTMLWPVVVVMSLKYIKRKGP